MAAPLSLDNSRLAADSLSAALPLSQSTARDSGSELEGALRDLRRVLETVPFTRAPFLTRITEQARQLIEADSTLIALRQGGTIACAARSGPLGPALGTPMDSRSGISGECLRQGIPLTCADSQSDSRVDAEACHRLGVRSVVVVPIREGLEVVGLLEAFSSRAQAFADSHVAILEKLASLVAESRSQPDENQSPSLEVNSMAPLPAKAEPLVMSPVASNQRRSRGIEAFRLRPYQIALVIGFLLLDAATLYFWQR